MAPFLLHTKLYRPRLTADLVVREWLSLDEPDGDLRLFLSYAVAAVRGLFSDACRQELHFPVLSADCLESG